MKLDKAVFTLQGRRNHGGQGGHCDPPPQFLVLIEAKTCYFMIKFGHSEKAQKF